MERAESLGRSGGRERDAEWACFILCKFCIFYAPSFRFLHFPRVFFFIFPSPVSFLPVSACLARSPLLGLATSLAPIPIGPGSAPPCPAVYRIYCTSSGSSYSSPWWWRLWAPLKLRSVSADCKVQRPRGLVFLFESDSSLAVLCNTTVVLKRCVWGSANTASNVSTCSVPCIYDLVEFYGIGVMLLAALIEGYGCSGMTAVCRFSCFSFFETEVFINCELFYFFLSFSFSFFFSLVYSTYRSRNLVLLVM
jgi:hypothetical protein